MNGKEPILEILEKACRGRTAILTRRECRGFDPMSLAELEKNLRDLGRHGDGCLGDASAEIFGRDSANLGHATAWIDAGLVYEGFASAIGSFGSPETVFCLDPWAAQLRSRAAELAPTASWILVNDLAARKNGEHREYWEALETWFHSLSFSAIFPKTVWDQTLERTQEPSRPPTGPELFADKPGAWQWKWLVSARAAASVVLLVRYSGSLGHLRVLLDSVARQEGSREGIHLVILVGDLGEDPRAYLRWFGIAHPKQWVRLIRTTGDWRPELNQLLGKIPDATVVMVGDHAVLPGGFLETVRKGTRAALLGVPAGLEASAHILIGNLDPLQNYETLVASVPKEIEPKNEAARVVPPETWNDRQSDPASRLLGIVQRPSEANAETPLLLLELADLP